jgi:hypothetical protein
MSRTEAFRADALTPDFAQRRLSRKIGNGSRNRLEATAECARQAADRDLRVEGLSAGRRIGESHLGLR